MFDTKLSTDETGTSMLFNALVKYSFVAMAIIIGFSASMYADEGDQVRVVGSSTVYPFSTVVAERFGRASRFKTPIIESTGTGGGFKLFCSGVGKNTVDITNASRAILPSERTMCVENGVRNIIEVKVGYDGIVLVHDRNAQHFSITTRDIFLALAETIPDGRGGFVSNDNTMWSDVNPAFPSVTIEVLGPPPTSGTRDAFIELAMETGCKTYRSIITLEHSNPSRFKKICQTIRDDGAYIEAGENDNLIIQKLTSNENALGIVGFSFLNQNIDRVRAVSINGINPSFAAIAEGSYIISRPLFFYVKGEKIGFTKSLMPFVEAFLDKAATGEDGYLTYRGLVPMSAVEHQRYKHAVRKAMNSVGEVP